MEFLILLTVPLITGLICRLLAHQPWAGRANTVGAAATLVAGLVLIARVFTRGPVSAFGEMVYVDALGGLLVFTIVVIGFLAALYSNGYLERDVAHGKLAAQQAGWYHLGFHAFI